MLLISAPVALKRITVLSKGSSATRSAFVTFPLTRGDRTPPVFSRSISVRKVSRTASATRW